MTIIPVARTGSARPRMNPEIRFGAELPVPAEQTLTPDRMNSATKQRLHAAADRAKHIYPGAVGELLNQELLSWMIFGHLLGSDLILRLADDILGAPEQIRELERRRIAG